MDMPALFAHSLFSPFARLLEAFVDDRRYYYPRLLMQTNPLSIPYMRVLKSTIYTYVRLVCVPGVCVEDNLARTHSSSFLFFSLFFSSFFSVQKFSPGKQKQAFACTRTLHLRTLLRTPKHFPFSPPFSIIQFILVLYLMTHTLRAKFCS